MNSSEQQLGPGKDVFCQPPPSTCFLEQIKSDALSEHETILKSGPEWSLPAKLEQLKIGQVVKRIGLELNERLIMWAGKSC